MAKEKELFGFFALLTNEIMDALPPLSSTATRTVEKYSSATPRSGST